MTRQHDVHVSADPGRVCWRVRLGGRTLSNHRTQSSALSAARRVARRHQVDLVTHAPFGSAAGFCALTHGKRNGRIRSKDSYGNERTTKDTEL
jgi:hypothetical protein